MNNSHTNYLSNSAFISICTIIFIGGLLIIASSVFTGDIQKIVLTPIENMINMIELICSGIYFAFHYVLLILILILI